MSGSSGIHLQASTSSATDIPAATRRGDFWFRLFNHATLALAGVCLVHGEAYYIPLLPWCLLPYLLFLVAAFRAEGRWTMTDRWANVCGVSLVVVMGLWIWFQPGGPGVLRGTEPWVRLVPYIGPFLMALVTIYLFRPKDPNHFWYVQGMGLVQVALACVLATSPLFGFLMAVYLTCALGCLALHYLSVPSSPGKSPSWRWLTGFVARYSLVVAASALAAFLFTPRSNAPPWDPLQRFSGRGPSPSRWPPPDGLFQGANLNGTTPVMLRNDEAFSLRATDYRGPKLDLSRETRFRCLVLENYQDGIWPSDVLGVPYRVMTKANPLDKDRLPDFGREEYFLHFDVKPKLSGGLVLAEPVRLGPEGTRRSPIALTDFSMPHALLFFIEDHSGTLLSAPKLAWSEYHYKQVMAPTVEANRTPAELGASGGQFYVQELTKQALPRLETWTAALLRRLAGQRRYDLPAEALVPDPRWPDRSYRVEPAYRERVARTLCAYLRDSGEYTYSLEQRRRQLNLDPVEDFLFNVKEGHCERFASALVLMLRTQGIPARLIKGYRGVDSVGDGKYVVRQNMAHAWVEVLVRRPLGNVGPAYDWLSLDPTPGLESARQPSPVAEWWKDKTGAGADMWQRLIVGYDADNQADVFRVFSPTSVWQKVLKETFGYIIGWLSLLIALVLVFARWMRGRRRKRNMPVSAAGIACYTRLVRLLQRRGRLPKRSAQTPRELATVAARALAGQPVTAALAGLPDQVVDLFYRVRFGDESPERSEVIHVNARLDELASALARSGPLVSPAGG
jgi:protein-glutamine gamma-glutamyltransferase